MVAAGTRSVSDNNARPSSSLFVSPSSIPFFSFLVPVVRGFGLEREPFETGDGDAVWVLRRPNG